MADSTTTDKDREYAELADFTVRMCKVVVEPPMAGTPVEVPPELADAARVIMFHFGRAFRTFQALGLLLREGYTQDGLVLLRTFVEVFFEMAFVAQHPDEAHYYIEHGLKVESLLQQRAKKHAPPFMAPLLFLDRLGDSEQEDVGERLSHSAWHPRFRSTRARALAAGVPESDYELIYSLCSRYVHGSGDWLREVAKAVPGGIHVSYSADITERNLIMLIACEKLLEMLFILEGCLRVPIRAEILSIKRDFDAFKDRGAARVEKKYGHHGASRERGV
jgi:hypothetical protein